MSYGQTKTKRRDHTYFSQDRRPQKQKSKQKQKNEKQDSLVLSSPSEPSSNESFSLSGNKRLSSRVPRLIKSNNMPNGISWKASRCVFGIGLTFLFFGVGTFVIAIIFVRHLLEKQLSAEESMKVRDTLKRKLGWFPLTTYLSSKSRERRWTLPLIMEQGTVLTSPDQKTLLLFDQDLILMNDQGQRWSMGFTYEMLREKAKCVVLRSGQLVVINGEDEILFVTEEGDGHKVPYMALRNDGSWHLPFWWKDVTHHSGLPSLPSVIQGGTHILSNQKIVSANKRFSLVFDDLRGHLTVWKHGISSQEERSVAHWCSHPFHPEHQVNGTGPWFCTFTLTGNLMIYDSNRKVTWSSQSAQCVGRSAVFLEPDISHLTPSTSQFSLSLTDEGYLELFYPTAVALEGVHSRRVYWSSKNHRHTLNQKHEEGEEENERLDRISKPNRLFSLSSGERFTSSERLCSPHENNNTTLSLADIFPSSVTEIEEGMFMTIQDATGTLVLQHAISGETIAKRVPAFTEPKHQDAPFTVLLSESGDLLLNYYTGKSFVLHSC